MSNPGEEESGPVDARVRSAIYDYFADTGRAPAAITLAERAGITVAAVESALHRLADAHAIALAPGTSNIWMAHPYSAVPTAYPVRTAARTYWANCAWDAFGIPALLRTDADMSTRCAESGETLRIRATRGELSVSDGVVHFLVPARAFWENVGFT